MEFVEHLKKYLKDDEIKALMESFSKSEQKGLFLNTNKISEETFLNRFPNVIKHPLVKNAYLYDKNEYEFGKKIYHELGQYYIQDPSASIVSYILPLDGDEKVLDLCAAPGGKTIQASLKLDKGGILVSNDLSKSRAITLLSNVERMGLGNVVVTSLDFSTIKDRLNSYFDAIILDAPCSGSGMFRKSEEMKADWTYEKVLKNASIQKDLILMCYSMLKDGGHLVYSTCSYSYEEDEEVIEYLLQNSDAKLVRIPSFKGEYRSPKYNEAVHLFPHLFTGEGHFICLIKKPGELKKSKVEPMQVKRATISKGNKREEELFILPNEIDDKIIQYSLRPGLLKETKGQSFVEPSHHYSHYVNASQSIELTKEEAIKFINGESINKNSPNGYYYVSFDKTNIGVVHAVNGVLKNLYPKGLRIKLSIDSSF